MRVSVSCAFSEAFVRIAACTRANPTTSDDPGNWRSETHRQLAAMTHNLPRIGSTKSSSQGYGRCGTYMVLRTSNRVAAAAGRSSTDDRMDVAQSSSSETDSTDAGSTDQRSVNEDTFHFSPSHEMGSETGPSSSSSTQAIAGGAAAGVKRKTEVGSIRVA